jgi:NitT/TauT family transport system substrate-binding protein
MNVRHPRRVNRRSFLEGLTFAATAGLLGVKVERAAAEPPPETTRLRIGKGASVCVSPLFVAAELLPAEGFSDVRYFERPSGVPGAKILGDGKADIEFNFAAPLVVALDAGYPIVVLARVHVGCFELFGTKRVRTIKDLKGKTVAAGGFNSAQHVFLSAMLAHVGLDPNRDVNWTTPAAADAKQMLADGKIDGYIGFPPDPQELRARKIGHVVVNSAVDRPWSQYFCCMAVANRDFVREHPVATKRALRAFLKGDTVCALEPERASKAYFAQGYKMAPDLVAQALKEIPFGRWREYDPADTLRFYALRLHEAGMIKSSPQKILAQGTDWRFLNDLKKELKG